MACTLIAHEAVPGLERSERADDLEDFAVVFRRGDDLRLKCIL